MFEVGFRMSRISEISVESLAPVYSSPSLKGLYNRLFKRFLDIILVLLAAPFLLPLVLAMGSLIRRDGGPAFYTQDRIGLDGRLFRIYKLRTMVVDADARLAAHLAADRALRAEWEENQKLKADPRVTAIGRLLRKTSLDELPQLWNVLKGDMSLVGPRPMMPEQRALYPGRAYYRMRPGLTGPWQVSDRNTVSFAGRADFDAAYAREMSLFHDISLMFVTIRVMVRGTGC